MLIREDSEKQSNRKFSHDVDGRGREVKGGPDHIQGVLPQNWGVTEPDRTLPCMVLKAPANDRSLESEDLAYRCWPVHARPAILNLWAACGPPSFSK
ncbi:hypothetical protein TNCV_3939091 [Trichonephila clavipes]|nr:hypothetical protein TNCV_3939091 [Trichonephila clavipes]